MGLAFPLQSEVQMKRILFRLPLITIAIFAIWSQLGAEPYSGVLQSGHRVPDRDTYLGINRNLVMVDNFGNLGFDHDEVFGRTPGWYYPFGSIDDILSGVEDRTVVYSSGLCLGGKVNGQIRAAITEYSPEFVPGPMSNGNSLPDDPRYRVYKLDATSGPGDADWDNWPADLGAPVDQYGFPQLRGDEILWTVFNDENAGERLGVEVQLAAWGYAAPGGADVVYARYKLYNRGNNVIDSFFFSFWADPDLGGSTDDLVGCDPATNSFFCYNGDDDDTDYGADPPAWGGAVVSGFLVPAAGQTGTFDGHTIADHRNLGMTAFSKYINGTDPQTPEEFFNFMRGRAADGSVVVNPVTGLPTSFMVSGDPVAGSGWLDSAPSDRRLMVTVGPITFAPGDSQQVELKLGARQGDSRLASITDLRSSLAALTPLAAPPATYIVDDPLFAYQLGGTEPYFPTCYVGRFDDNYAADDVDLSSLEFDGLAVSDAALIPAHPEYGGSAIALRFPLADYLAPLLPLVGHQLRSYAVTGQYLDGTSFAIGGDVMIVGKQRGDLDADGHISISDVVALIGFIFAAGAAPDPLALADTDCSGEISVGDVVYLIGYIFGSGPAPCN